MTPTAGVQATEKGRSVGALLDQAVRTLRGFGIDQPRLDAELLLAWALGWSRERLLRDWDGVVPREAVSVFANAISERGRRVPLQYLRGTQEFWGLSFVVSPAALIPRPETEHLIETSFEEVDPRGSAIRVLEIGTGTGCIAVSLAVNRPAWRFVATDLSNWALALARRNAVRHGVQDRVRFVCCDLFSGLRLDRFDLIVSNPPYIMSEAIPALQPEVSAYEPRIALDGGGDGLDFYRAILDGAAGSIHPSARLILEIGAGQRERVSRLAKRFGFSFREVNDLAGIPRVLVLYREG